MKYRESKPFSSGTEYEVFLYNWCENCNHYKVRDDGFPEFPENGGCPVLPRKSGGPYKVVQDEFEKWLRSCRKR